MGSAMTWLREDRGFELKKPMDSEISAQICDRFRKYLRPIAYHQCFGGI